MEQVLKDWPTCTDYGMMKKIPENNHVNEMFPWQMNNVFKTLYSYKASEVDKMGA